MFKRMGCFLSRERICYMQRPKDPTKSRKGKIINAHNNLVEKLKESNVDNKEFSDSRCGNEENCKTKEEENLNTNEGYSEMDVNFIESVKVSHIYQSFCEDDEEYKEVIRLHWNHIIPQLEYPKTDINSIKSFLINKNKRRNAISEGTKSNTFKTIENYVIVKKLLDYNLL